MAEKNNMLDEGKIRKEAKALIDDFASALEKVKFKEKKEKKEEGGFRGEREIGKEKTDLSFRKTMFENAPNTQRDCVVAEKKKW